MRWNLDATEFVPRMFCNLQEKKSNVAQAQQFSFAENHDFSDLDAYEISNYSNDSYNDLNLFQGDDLGFQSRCSQDKSRLNVGLTYIFQYLKPKKKQYDKFFKDIKKNLENGCNTYNIIRCINKIAENLSFSFAEKVSLMKKLSNYICKKSKNNSQDIDAFEIIKNFLLNKKISFRNVKFIEQIASVKVFKEQQLIEMIRIIIETERFDYVSIGFMLYYLNNSSFDLEVLNDLIKFSADKLKKNLIKNSDKFIEFLEILISRFKMSENTFTVDNYNRFVANDLKLYYMGYNLQITFFICCRLFFKNMSTNIRMKFVEVLFYECLNFDKNFASIEFLERYLYVINSYSIIEIIENNQILKQNSFFAKLHQRTVENIRFTDVLKEIMTKNENYPQNVKSFLNQNLKVIINSNYFVIKQIFNYCIKNNFIDVAAKLVEKFHFIYDCDDISKNVVLRIFDERNLNHNEKLIDEKCKFFITNIKHLRFEHLQRYKPDRVSRIFDNYFSDPENYEIRTGKLVIHAFVTKFVDPSFIKKYLKSVYEGRLEYYIIPMVKDYFEKNSKEKDVIVRENNLLSLIQSVISLPISGTSKIAFLNSCKLSKDKEMEFKNLLNNILSIEEALDQLVDILYLDFKYNESVRRVYEILE